MGNSSEPYSTFFLIALMVVAFYLLIIRPNKKRQQAQQQTLSSLTPGARVLLTSGVFGTLVEVGEKQAVLELSPGVHLTVLKQAIARTVREGDEDTAADDDYADEDLAGEDLNGEDLDGRDRAGGPVAGAQDDLDATAYGPSGSPDRGSHRVSGDNDTDPRSGTNTTPTRD